MTGTLRRPTKVRSGGPDRTVALARPPLSTARVVTVAGVLIALTVGLLGRLVDLQLTPDERILSEVAIPLGEVTVAAPRGQVIDRHGRTIALSLPAATIYAEPRRIVDPVAAAAALAPLLTDAGLTRAELTGRLSGDGGFSYVARQLDPSVGEAVRELALPGIGVIAEPRREHPNGSCSALGAVGRVNIDHVGMSGLEERHQERLAGEPGRIVKEVGSDGTTIPGGERVVVDAVPGDDLQVTLDRNIQYRAEQLLVDAVEGVRAQRAVALVAIPGTGEIVAMANVSRGADGVVACTRENLAATWSFEPGSILKPVTMASALATGAVGESEPLTVEPSVEIWDHVFRDDPWHDVAEWTPTDILTRSSNVGTIEVATRVGDEGLRSTLESFGLGSRTGLDFKGEAAGILPPIGEWSGLTLPNVAIGQGVATTALQMLQVYNTIANEGVRVEPTLLVEEVGDTDTVQVIDRATAAALLRMMTSVVDNGTGTAAAVAGYPTAGKTGTAWQPCDVGYLCDDGYHHVTAGFGAIVSSDLGPALTVLVVIDDLDPTGERTSGGKVAAPVVSELAGYALRQLRVPTAVGATPDERQRADAARPPGVESADEEADR